MILLTCTNCHQTLEIDDAFAGGVCRCSHCGAIQTVPSHLKGTGAAAGGAVAASQVVGSAADRRTLYAKPTGAETSGLEQLGEVISGSGLGSSGLSGRRGGTATRAPRASARKAGDPAGTRMLALAVAALAVVLAGGLILYVVNGRSAATKGAVPQGVASANPANSALNPPVAPPQTVGRSADPSNEPSADPAANPAAPAGPAFAGVPLGADSVAFVLDRGDSARQTFGFVARLTEDAIAQLGPRRKFQVLFWDPVGTPDPGNLDTPDQLRLADADAAERAAKVLDDLTAGGQTDADAAFARAVEQNPAAIVLVTAKGWQLDADFARRMLAVIGGKKIRVHTFALGGGESDGLRQLADRTGGTFAPLDLNRLRELIN